MLTDTKKRIERVQNSSGRLHREGRGSGANSRSGTGTGTGTGELKNTRRRHHPQKRSRNQPKKKEDASVPVPVVSVDSSVFDSKPVIGSSNPFFVAVCAPESYVPSVNPQRTSNMFLKPVLSGNYSRRGPSSSGSNTINHFIHHPAIQNDRMRENCVINTANVASASASASASVVFIKEQFPSLSCSASNSIPSSTVSVQSKMNFKEMVMKTVSNVAPTTSVAPSMRVLSSGNIFLGAFTYNESNNNNNNNDNDNDNDNDIDNDNDNDNDNEITYNGSRKQVKESTISSILVDSCDSKYDRLYK